MKNQQRGFTLIELIMVVAILGILAAFALPKFADLSSEARKATIQGVGGAMRAASGIAHAAFIAKNSASITMEGSSYTLVFGYPDSRDIIDMAGTSSTDSLTLTPGADAAATTATASLGTNCTATYTEASATVPASVTVNATGC